MNINANIIHFSFGWILLLSVTACQKVETTEKSIRPALVMQVEASNAQNKLSIVGEIQPRYSAVQAFRIGGKIVKRYVEIGEPVKKGQLIAKIDASDANLSVEANEAAIQAAKANLSFAKSELARQQKLLDKAFISPSALERYQTSFDTAKARLKQVSAQNAVTINQSAYTRLNADRTGVVNQIKAEPGQVVAAGEPVVTIISPQTLEVHVQVAESSIDKIELKQKVKVKLWSSDSQKTYPATVREIAPVANPVTRTYLVKITLNQIDSKMKMGMTATAIIPTSLQTLYMIPGTAVVQRGDQAIIWQVNADNTVSASPVKIAQYHENGVLISSGINQGQTIVIAGAHVLTDGQAIEPMLRAL